MSSSSSDSESGERLRNVNSTLVKLNLDKNQLDENCSYKRKLGDLIFNANFESANLGLVEQIDDYEYDLMVRPDVANARHSFWFNFTVCNQRPDQCVIFTFVNLSESCALFHDGFSPVVRSKSNPNWRRLHEDQVFYYKSANHQNRLVLSLAFRFDKHDDEHQFALSFPYTYTQMFGFISRWQVELRRRSQLKVWQTPKRINHRKSPEIPGRNSRLDYEIRCRSSQSCREEEQPKLDAELSLEQLELSVLMKSIHLVSIKSSQIEDRNKPNVLVLCRFQGNLDGAASIVCQGLIDFMLGDHAVSREARKQFNLFAIPMMDPDSVWAGNSQSSIVGHSSITRKVVEANTRIYCNYLSIQRLIEKLSKSNSRLLLIELKVNYNLIGSRILATKYDDSVRMERHLSFVRLMSRFCDFFYLENCKFQDSCCLSSNLFDFSRESNVDQYRLEVSPFAHYKRSSTNRKYQQLGQEKYLSLGKSLSFALLELLRCKTDAIPHCVAATLESFRNVDQVEMIGLRLIT